MYVDARPHLWLKTRPRFCPVSLSLSIKRLNKHVRTNGLDRTGNIARGREY
jgi:hypothetical protein